MISFGLQKHTTSNTLKVLQARLKALHHECFLNSSSVQELILYTLPLNMPYKQQSHRLRSGEQGGHNSLLIVLSPKTPSE